MYVYDVDLNSYKGDDKVKTCINTNQHNEYDKMTVDKIELVQSISANGQQPMVNAERIHSRWP